MSGLDINLAPIAAISDKAEADSPPPRYSEVMEDGDVELGAGGGIEAATVKKSRERFICYSPNRETLKNAFVVIMVLIIFVTFILAIVNATRIHDVNHRSASTYSSYTYRPSRW